MEKKGSFKEKIVGAQRLIDDWLSYQRYRRELPGMSVGIFADDEVVFHGTYGCADIEHDVPTSADTMYRIASHSKVFTATAIMLLYNRNQLSLDDRVSKYISWFRSDKDENLEHVRIRQLLTHSSGMIRDGDTGHWLNFEFPDVNELRRQIVDGTSSVFETNEHFKYSNFAYSVAGLIVEAASGMAYGDFIQKEILDPLGMTHTTADYREQDEGSHAAGYGERYPGEQRQRFPHIPANGMQAATGFSSTVSDLIRFYRAHMMGNEALLPDRDKREMQRLQFREKDTEWALGFGRMSLGGMDFVGHGGGYPGFITASGLNQDHKLILVVLTNSADGPAMTLLDGLAGLIKKIDENWDELQGSETVDAQTLERIAGFYRERWGVKHFGAIRGSLVGLEPDLTAPGSELRIYDHVGDTKFREPNVNHVGPIGEILEFVPASTVGEYDMLQGGMRIHRWRF